MGLKRYKLGELIRNVDERNLYGIKNFYGLNIDKEFMPTVANTEGLDETKYKVVRTNRFVFSGMQTGRDECIRVSMYLKDESIIVSPAYTTFEIESVNIIIPTYFFMIFLSKEKDRLGWFYSDGSIRSNLDWNRFCDINIDLPPIEIQQKYVNIYKAMIANQKSYERGLEDLKLVCDSHLDKFKHTEKRMRVGDLLEEIDTRNTKGTYKEAHGININKEFMPSLASSDDLCRYKIVSKNQFAYSSMQTGRDKCIRIALLKNDNPIIVSPAYSVLQRTSSETDIIVK